MENQIKTIINNMEQYAKKNSCDFNKTFINSLIGTRIYFYEYGCLLIFSYNEELPNIFIEQFSEDSNLNNNIMSKKEFIKFQERFLKE